MFDKDKTQFMRRWELLTGYVELIDQILGTYNTDTLKLDVIRFIFVTLDYVNDEVPMSLINYTRGYINLNQKLPPISELSEVKHA